MAYDDGFAEAEEPVLAVVGSGSKSDPTDQPTEMRDALLDRFRACISPNAALTRALVSFQANKRARFYNWFRYREGFSEALVTHLLTTISPTPGVLLDPFAGSGSTLFAGSTLGWSPIGIEVLPVGAYAIRTRALVQDLDTGRLRAALVDVLAQDFAAHYDVSQALAHIPITRGAFPDAQERELVGYLAYCRAAIRDDDVRDLLLYAAFCVLEEISFTRKDGQYLRWDYRAGRRQGKRPFNKGRIVPFREAITRKLEQIASDLDDEEPQGALFVEVAPAAVQRRDPLLIQGSCLDVLPTTPTGSIDMVLTSPPYANRYDYTRTYALELVYLGCTDADVKNLRQAMLSCTVENKAKRDQLQHLYAERGQRDAFEWIDTVFERQAALHEVLDILDDYRASGQLNNDNIAQLVRNYFYEMCFVIYELARLLRPGGTVVMVNDNVRYAGEEVPVDLILSSMAEAFGLRARHIWTLGRGKGNSSQQMGNHGRSELRKCVYVWEKVAHAEA
jgi:DNA modification methylase